MKKYLIRTLLILSCLLLLLPTVVSAAAYRTYTYSIDGTQLDSPDAYTPNKVIDYKAMGLPENLSDPSDLVIDCDQNVYIVDRANSAVYAMDPAFNFRYKISTFVNSNGIDDSLLHCEGCYVTPDYVYVADTDNERIVLFDRMTGAYVRHIEAPESDIFEENEFFSPVAVAVDVSGRIYVVSTSDYQGLMALNAKGEFEGFIGAQKVSYNAVEALWRSFQTAEQRASSVQNIPTGYNNVTIDEGGFLYATSSYTDDSDLANNQQAAIQSKDGTYAPVKRFNAAGDDILGRNGFFGPGGEVEVNYDTVKSNIIGPSRIVDVALGPSGSWSIIDQKRSKVFTYDQYGQLLFAFGDKGEMLGNIQTAKAIAYQGTNMLILDSASLTVTLYIRTEYGDTLIKALQNEIDRKHDEAVADYQEILKRNSNFDAAYIGIGKAYYRQGNYDEAMDMFRCAYETANYSQAFSMKRQQWANKYFIIIPIVVIVLLIAITKFFGYAAKVNKATAVSGGKRTFKQEILFAFHLIFHPFDGFWDLKHEKRGSVRGAIFYLILELIAVFYNAVGRSYIFNPRGDTSGFFSTSISLLVPLILWVVANWCLTTLFEGEGSMKDIFIATCYALVPLVLLMIPATALTNILTASEAQFYNILMSVAWVWTGLLIFFGTMVTHDYSIGKNVLITVATIVGMAFIMFCVFLFSTLLIKMVDFISGIVTEISYNS